MLAAVWATWESLERLESILWLSQIRALAPLHGLGSEGMTVKISPTCVDTLAFVFNTFQYMYPASQNILHRAVSVLFNATSRGEVNHFEANSYLFS